MSEQSELPQQANAERVSLQKKVTDKIELVVLQQIELPQIKLEQIKSQQKNHNKKGHGACKIGTM